MGIPVHAGVETTNIGLFCQDGCSSPISREGYFGYDMKGHLALVQNLTLLMVSIIEKLELLFQ